MPLLTTKEFAKALGCSRTTVSGLIAKGFLIPTDRDGRINLFSQDLVPEMKLHLAIDQAAKPHLTIDQAVKKSYVYAAVNDAVESEVCRITHEHLGTINIMPVPTAAADTNERFWSWGGIDKSIAKEEIKLGPIVLQTIQNNTPESQVRVPRVDKNFQFDPSSAVVLANAFRNAEPTWIWGPSGSGKTSDVKQLCSMLNWPLYRVNMTSDFSVADFVGQTQVVIDEKTGQAITKFVDGILIHAMLNGGVLLIDEVTATPPGVLMALQSVLERDAGADLANLWDSGKSWCSFVNTENGGEVIHAHPRFRVIVADNTNGQGDVTGAYAGTHVMNEAFRSRFTQWLWKEYPNRADWIKIVMSKTGIDAPSATQIVEIALDVNSGSALFGAKTVTNESMINPRDTLAIARLYSSFGNLAVAFVVGLLNGMQADSPDRQFIADLVRNRGASPGGF